MKITAIFLALAAFCFLTSGGVKAQSNKSDDEAWRVLKAAFQFLGGETKITSLGSIFVRAKGVEHRSADVQGYHPEQETNAAHEEKLAVFLDGKRLAYEYHTGRHDGTTRWRRTIFTAERRIFADFITKSASAAPVTFPSLERTQAARRLPHIILLEALANASSLQYSGTRIYEDKEHEVISLQFPSAKTPVFLWFDKKTSLLSKYEFAADFPGLGESFIEYTFSEYRPHPKLGWFPSNHSIKVGGKVWRTMKYEQVAVDSTEAEEMLELSPELEGFIAAPGTVKEIAKGVFLVYRLGGYQPLFIEFKDFVLAVESPATHPFLEGAVIESLVSPNALSEQLISLIKATIKNKQIKYVVPTHYHSDHAGGVRAFAAENSIILSTPGNKTFFEKFAPGMKMEFFENKRTVSDGERTVELINVGANPHTAENIVVYLPKEKYLYQGDLFYFNGDATFPPRNRDTVMPFFAKWLKQNNLSPARIYGFHSVSFATMEHIEKILETNAKTKN